MGEEIRDKNIEFITQWYVEKIVNIFAESRKDGEEPVIAVNIGSSAEAMQLGVAYTADQLQSEQFLHESGEHEMPEGNVRDIVQTVNMDEPPLFYREKIVKYFEEYLTSDYVVVKGFTVIYKH